MPNKRIVVKGRSYFVDTDANNFGLSTMLASANLSGDEDKVMRTLHATIILALGLDVVLAIPMQDFQEVVAAVARALNGQE